MVKGHTHTKQKNILLALSLLGVFCLCTNTSTAYADTSINMSLDSSTVVLDLLPLGDYGTFAKSDNLTIDVSVSGPGGYTIGISSTGSTDLVNQRDSTKVFSSIVTSISELDFAEDSVAAANNNEKWGYLPNKFNSLNNSLFLPAPGEGGDVLDVTHGTNDEGEYEIAIGARASLDTPPGAYSNTFVITAVSNYSCSVGDVCYFGNEEDAGVMENQSIPAGATEVTLVGLKYRRNGYGFAGWSTTLLDPDDANFVSDFAAATVYGPMETVTIPTAGYLELYAVWVPSSGNMQEWSGCSTMNTGDVIGLTDTRDGNVYAVAKLINGECWQVENLRLDFSDENLMITNLNTNHPVPEFINDANVHPEPKDTFSETYDNDYSKEIQYNSSGLEQNYTYGIYYNFPTIRAGNYHRASYSDSETGDICPAGWSKKEAYHGIIGALSGVDLNIYDSSSEPTGDYMSRALRSFPNNFVIAGVYQSSSPGIWMVGGMYPSNSLTNMNSSLQFHGMMILGSTVYRSGYYIGLNPFWNGFSFRCVAGTTKDYTLTYDANGGVGAPVSETINSASGVFQSISTVVPTRNGYSFIGWIDKDGVEVQPGGGYNPGVDATSATLYAIWNNNMCNNSATTINTGSETDAVCMQDMNGAVKNAMAIANTIAGSIQTFQLIDERDGQSYNVALLDDGNVWMTKNLNIGKNNPIVLSHYDTNIPSTSAYILPASGTDYYNGELNDGYYNGDYYGGYYRWKVAISSNISYNYSAGNRSTSICPFKWVLPTAEHYARLINAASLNNFSAASLSPYNFTYGGIWTNGFNPQSSTAGRLWTSSYPYGGSEGTNATSYTLSSSSFSSGSLQRSYALNIRCVAENGAATFNYNGNGSSDFPVVGSMPSRTVSLDTGKITRNEFTRTGYAFKTWNTRADGTGVDIAPNTNMYSLGLSDGDEVTLYAQWTPQTVITYDDNFSGTRTTSTINAGSSTTLGQYYYFTTRTGYSIKEWNTEPDGSGTTYAVGSTYSFPADSNEPAFLTLYAQWVENCTITYVNTITNETQSKTVTWNLNSRITIPNAWTNSAYKMAGWDTVTNNGTGGGGTVVYEPDAAVKLTEDLTIYTVWVPTYTIQYSGNGASGTTNMAVTHRTEGNEEIVLYASNYSNSGYGFAGWSFDQNAADDLSSAVIYGPNETITTPALTTPGEVKTLYAVWVEPESGVTMQTFDGSAAPYNTAAAGSVIALTDSRDNDTYAVAKLADGNWWMVENLRLGTTSSMLLDSSTSAISGSITLPASSSSFAKYYYTPNMNSLNKTSTVSAMDNANSNIFSYGNYYTWNAATASGSSDNQNVEVDKSVCPYGWHLPSGADNGEFVGLSSSLDGLTSQMNSNTIPTGASFSKTLRKFPNNFLYSGYYSGSSSSSRGTIGYYWSSRSSSGSYAYILSISNTVVNPLTTTYRYNGSSVRCIAGNGS